MRGMKLMGKCEKGVIIGYVIWSNGFLQNILYVMYYILPDERCRRTRHQRIIFCPTYYIHTLSKRKEI